jgi:aryl-alcohol dehydrogenase-like predicted oxidoreductase
MMYRELGEQGPEVTAIGLGAWAIGGPWEYGWGSTDDQQAIAAIRQAIDLGITFIDTADVYGLGHSEEIVGKALGADRRKIFLATKGGTAWDVNGKTSYNSQYEYLVRAIEASLIRLQTDYVDLYQIHWPDPSTPFDETARALDNIRTSGKARYIGVSNFSVNQMESLGTDRILSLQTRYNLLEREAEKEILPYCAKYGIGVLAYAPMAHGLLTGKFSQDLSQHLPPDDMRWRKRCFNKDNLPRNLQIVEKLKPIAKDLHIPLSQLAINWVLHNSVVSVALVGGRNPKQVVENAGAADWSLSEDIFTKIGAILTETI